ncbi:MAG: hypothetical protein HOV79_31435 [Hamadaea sp.]|nr:hypothetical protein [Hamadaea sp.]
MPRILADVAPDPAPIGVLGALFCAAVVTVAAVAVVVLVLVKRSRR